MNTIALSAIRKSPSRLLGPVAYGGERIRLSLNGQDFVAVISIEDLEFFEALEDHMDIEEAKAALKEKGSVAWEKVKADVGL